MESDFQQARETHARSLWKWESQVTLSNPSPSTAFFVSGAKHMVA